MKKIKSKKEADGFSITKFRKRIVLIFVGLIIVSLAFTYSKREKVDPAALCYYVTESSTLKITYSPDWIQSEETIHDLLNARFVAPNDAGIVQVYDYFAQSAPLLGIQESYSLFQILIRYSQKDLPILSNHPATVADCSAIAFNGINLEGPFRGWVIKNGMQIYILIATSTDPQQETEFWADVDQMITAVRVKKQTVTTDDIIKELKISKPDSLWTAAEELHKGRNYLHARNISVRNYLKAIRSFQKVLLFTSNKSPRPPEYDTAMRLFFITKVFQQKAFIDWRFLLNRNIGIGQKSKAEKYAHCIKQLFPENDMNHGYIVRKLAESESMKFDN